ncbi:MAG TPA: ABC transporter permease subunit [Nitrososphaeria archaeon]|nr:ABC transporter permease subunit [Nitrososphaeria archaeon]
MSLWAALINVLAALGFSWARMTIALLISIGFSLCVGIAAAVNQLAEKTIIPILDVLQSIPILSFFPIALYAFISIHPVVGPELAAIFLIFTSQAWNIAFGVYEGVRLIPSEILEVSRSLGFGRWRRIMSVYLPAAFPKIASNLPPSWANGLYFLVACEVITIGEAEWRLFGIGTLSTSYILSGRILEFLVSLAAVVIAIILMNLLVFIPLMRLGERYKFEERAAEVPRVWFEKLSRHLITAIERIFPRRLKLPSIRIPEIKASPRILKAAALTVVAIAAALLSYHVSSMLSSPLVGEQLLAALDGFVKLGVISPLTMIGFSLMRVSLAIIVALLWTIPMAILIHEKRLLEDILVPFFQIVASFPATLILPFIAKLIVDLRLPLELGALLMILLGTQWYVLFFLIDGLRGIPLEEEEVCRSLGIEGFSKFRHLYLPRMLPSLIMGCLVAMGGGWNTLVVAERIVLENFTWDVGSPGIGRMLSIAVSRGDLPLLIASTLWMVGFIVVLNRLFWRRIYEKAVEIVGAAR